MLSEKLTKKFVFHYREKKNVSHDPKSWIRISKYLTTYKCKQKLDLYDIYYTIISQLLYYIVHGTCWLTSCNIQICLKFLIIRFLIEKC